MFRHDLAPRIFFDEPIELRQVLDDNNASTLSGRALNLSIGGMYVRAYVALPEAARVEVRFLLPTGVVVHAEATVLRSTPGAQNEACGIALRFDGIEREAAYELDQFIEDRLKPANGQTVRLQLGKTRVRARAQASWGNVISVDAELPFLKLGSLVDVHPSDQVAPGAGEIRWVAVHVCPDSGVPRLNIGIELEEREVTLPEYDELADPIYTREFAEHARLRDRQMRDARKRGASA